MTPAVSAAGSQLPAALPASVLADGTDTYDVAVIGFGIAGGCAALEAARAGARVLVLERAAVPGGTSCLAGGHFYLGGGTPVQQATGHQDSAEEMYKYLVATAKDPEHDKIRAYCAGSVEHFGWLESLGFRFERSYFAGKAVIQPGTEGLMFSGNEQVWPFRELARPAPRGHKVPVPGDTQGARLVVDLLRDRIAETGAEVRYETGATNLVTDEAGGVAGLAWRSFAETGLVRAGATVLAAGGFVMNAAMVAEHTPALGAKLITLGSTYDDGLGIRLGMSVAADVRHMDEPFITAPFYPPSGLVTGLIVNSHGERFVAEDSYHARTSQFVLEQPGAAAYLIVDSAHVEQPQMPLVPLLDGYETVPEMEQGLGLSAGSLAGTLARYNQLRRPRRGPGLPQERRVAGGPGSGPVGSLRPAARPGPVRRVHARRPAHHGRRAGAAARRLGRPGAVRGRGLRVQHRSGRQGVRLRHPARRGVVLRPPGRPARGTGDPPSQPAAALIPARSGRARRKRARPLAFDRP